MSSVVDMLNLVEEVDKGSFDVKDFDPIIKAGGSDPDLFGILIDRIVDTNNIKLLNYYLSFVRSGHFTPNDSKVFEEYIYSSIIIGSFQKANLDMFKACYPYCPSALEFTGLLCGEDDFLGFKFNMNNSTIVNSYRDGYLYGGMCFTQIYGLLIKSSDFDTKLQMMRFMAYFNTSGDLMKCLTEYFDNGMLYSSV